MIELREYTPSICSLDARDMTYLLSLVRSSPEESTETKVLQSLTPTTRPGSWQLTPGPYVGRLGLPSGAFIDFQSRFDFPDVIRLIQLAGSPGLLMNPYPVPAKPGLLFIDAIASAYAREVGRLVGRGLSKAYQRHRQTKPPFGGRIDVAFHLARFAGRADVLVTQRRRLTVDIAINQALGAALEVLHRVPLVPAVAQDLAHLRPAFNRVLGTGVSASDVARIQLHGENTRYAAALSIAELVLRSQDLLPTESGVQGSSILFFMPRVWESYVARWVAAQYKDDDVDAQYPFRITDAGLLARADVVVRSGRTIKAVFDAKYKPSLFAPDRPDIYQMVTYCEALNLEEATLVYPGITHPKTVNVKGKSIHLLGLALDLSDIEAAEVAA